MGNRTSTLSRRYRVVDDVEVKVTNMVGSGQPGGWAMSLDGEFLDQGDDRKTVVVGKGADLLYRELRVEFVLHDRRWEHNRLTATSVLTGGENEEPLTISHEQAGEPGDSATYTTLVQFV